MSDALVKHAFVSAVPEGADATKIRTSNWNASLLFTGGNLGELLTRDPASATGASWVAAPAAVTKASLGLSNVENTALSTWAGSGVLNTWTGLQTFSGGAAITGVMSTSVNGIAVTSTDGSVLQNSTAATAGVPVQQSPRARQRGSAWGTTAGTSQTIDFFTEVLPTTGATAQGSWRLGVSVNGAAATYPLSLNESGALTVTNLNLGSAGSVVFAAAGYLTAGGGTGLFLLRNFAATAGVGFDVATDAIFKIRTRALSGFATVDALGYRASGVAGVSFGPAHPASITIVNGIVTACS